MRIVLLHETAAAACGIEPVAKDRRVQVRSARAHGGTEQVWVKMVGQGKF